MQRNAVYTLITFPIPPLISLPSSLITFLIILDQYPACIFGGAYNLQNIHSIYRFSIRIIANIITTLWIL